MGRHPGSGQTIHRSLKADFSRSLAMAGGRLHLAAHSHHLWPDASWAGQQAAWDDAAQLWDAKWDRVFGHVMPTAQRHIAAVLGLADPATIAFAPSTHEFILRLLSACPPKPRVLTTDGEFHSLARQLARLEEDDLASVTRVPTRPFATFPDRFAAAASATPVDLVFFSHVFFGSGWVVPDLERLVRAAPAEALVVIDGYHGFFARPTDLGAIQDRAFYLAGGYKYAMSGEGVCFMHCPQGFAPRPRDTGWFAAFGALADQRSAGVAYGADGTRFAGATFDPSGLYRFVSVMDWFAHRGLAVADTRARAHALHAAFAPRIDALGVDGLRGENLIVPLDTTLRGNFLAYESPRASTLHAALARAGIVTDLRENTLRIGFGLYHDIGDVPEMVGRVAEAVRPRCAPATPDPPAAA